MKRFFLILAPALLGCAASHAQPVASPPVAHVEVQLQFSGALTGPLVLGHVLDPANRCGPVAGQPALHAMTASGPVEVPPGAPPHYDLNVADGPNSFGLSPLAWQPGQTSIDEPRMAFLWVGTAQGKYYLNHGAPSVGLRVAFAADGLSGAVEATGLMAQRDGKDAPDLPRLDLRGTWRCVKG